MMDVSLLTKYSGYPNPAYGPGRTKYTGHARYGQPAANMPIVQDIGKISGAVEQNNRNPQNLLKRVGYTELNGSWDQYMLSRFVDLIERSTGNTLDTSAIMRRYDADGDGLLNVDEQAAMIEGLTKAEFGKDEISRSVSESIVEQLKELSEEHEPKYAAGLLRAIRRYERLFLYDNKELPEEPAVLAI